MSIKYESQVVAECDQCGTIEITSIYTTKEFARMMRKNGWRIGKECICDKCKEADE